MISKRGKFRVGLIVVSTLILALLLLQTQTALSSDEKMDLKFNVKPPQLGSVWHGGGAKLVEQTVKLKESKNVKKSELEKSMFEVHEETIKELQASISKPLIEQEILEELNDTEWVSVTITLKDTSNLTYASAKTQDEKSIIYKKRKELNNKNLAVRYSFSF